MNDIHVTDEHSVLFHLWSEVQELIARGHVFLTKEELRLKNIPTPLPEWTPPPVEESKQTVSGTSAEINQGVFSDPAA